MELKQGYKQTEVGVIPEDWDCVSIQSAASNTSNAIVGGPFGSDLTSSDYVYSGVPVVRGANLGSKMIGGSFVFVSTSKASALAANLARPQDLVFTQRGTLGQVSLVPDEPFESYLISQSQMKVSLDGARYGSEYVYHYFSSAPGQKQILDSAIQTGVPHTNLGICRKYVFPAPCITEQEKICDVLNDIDSHLQLIGRLLDKKKQIKQAAMQELLTGKRRLPGFEGEWEVKRLGDHVRFLKNGVNSRAELYPGACVRYLHYGDIHASSGSFLSPQDLTGLPVDKATGLDRLQDGDLIFADASEDIAGVSRSVELCGTSDFEAVSGLHTIAARFDKAILADGFKGFLQYVPSFSKQLRRLAAGTKVYATSRAHISSAEVRLPPVAEQKAIAEVLMDMSNEIGVLRERMNKACSTKQGMMQQLLTGKIRLI